MLRNLLLSARISGRREHGRRDPRTRSIVAAPITSETSECAAIITPGVSDRLREVLGDPARRRVQPWNRRSYLLHGLARCGHVHPDGSVCGMPPVARPRAGGARCYVYAGRPGFGGCGKIRITAEDLEAQVQADVVAAIDGGAFAEALRESDSEGDAPTARQETIRLQEKLDALAVQFAADEFTHHEWQTMRRGIAERLEATERRYAELPGTRLLVTWPTPLLPAWEAFDYGQRRSVVVDLVSEVRTGPGILGLNRFDPHRLTIIWKV